jgi:hypothetical protein
VQHGCHLLWIIVQLSSLGERVVSLKCFVTVDQKWNSKFRQKWGDDVTCLMKQTGKYIVGSGTPTFLFKQNISNLLVFLLMMKVAQ